LPYCAPPALTVDLHAHTHVILPFCLLPFYHSGAPRYKQKKPFIIRALTASSFATGICTTGTIKKYSIIVNPDQQDALPSLHSASEFARHSRSNPNHSFSTTPSEACRAVPPPRTPRGTTHPYDSFSIHQLIYLVRNRREALRLSSRNRNLPPTHQPQIPLHPTHPICRLRLRPLLRRHPSRLPGLPINASQGNT
jgi:hypothetical protein